MDYYIFILIIVLFFAFIISVYTIFNFKNNIIFRFLAFILIFLIISCFFFKEVFLPFLARAAYPPFLIPSEIHPANTNFSIELDFNLPNGSKIIYWAANSNNNDIYNNPTDAYGNFKNSGVAIVNNNKTILHLNCPNRYKIPSGMTLNKHIHYRIALPNDPILSAVKTIFINC